MTLEYIRKDNEFYFYLKTYSKVKYLCLGIDCHTVILKQIKYEKK